MIIDEYGDPTDAYWIDQAEHQAHADDYPDDDQAEHAGYIVVLSKDLRKDDAEATLNAIRQIKGVVGVEPVAGDS